VADHYSNNNDDIGTTPGRPSSTTLSYAESNTNYKNDMGAVSDAAAEIYSYSYNKNVDATSTNPSPPTPAAAAAAAPEGVTKGASPLSKAEVEKVKASHDEAKEEASQGGSKFRSLIERAKDQKSQGARQPDHQSAQTQQQQQQYQQQQQQYTGATTSASASTTPPSSIMTPEEMATLSIDEQARLYREFFYVQQKQQKQQIQQLSEATATLQQQLQQLQQQQTLFPPPQVPQPQQQQQLQQQPIAAPIPAPKSIGSTPDNYLAAGIGMDGRKIGRNKDADMISTAADVYMARLKRDSTTRNIARYSGDDSKANDVFHDPSIETIEAPVNPYLKDQQQRMRDVIETVPEEMLIFREFDDETEEQQLKKLKSYSGVSYKEKMQLKKQEREDRRRSQ